MVERARQFFGEQAGRYISFGDGLRSKMFCCGVSYVAHAFAIISGNAEIRAYQHSFSSVTGIETRETMVVCFKKSGSSVCVYYTEICLYSHRPWQFAKQFGEIVDAGAFA